MLEDEFRHWLKEYSGLSEATQTNALSRCRRIERCEGDVDVHFAQDRCGNLLMRMNYSTQDELAGRSSPHNVPIASGSSIRHATTSLKYAVRTYMDFKSWHMEPGNQERASLRVIRSPRSTSRDKITARWPDWSTPSERDVLLLAQLAVPYIRFIEPDIVSLVVEDNEIRRGSWSMKLSEHGIDSRLYLWEGSSCAFPGIRRAIGGKETTKAQKVAEREEPLEQALVVDSNHYPKEIWSFTFLGKRFPNFGPAGYSLAHLLDHQSYKNRGIEELLTKADSEPVGALYGLFTCVSNAVFIPSSLIKPTDFSFALRNLIQRKAASLYSGVCELLPKGMSFKTVQAPEWDLDQFDWQPPVGTTSNIPAFLTYRAEVMSRLLPNP